MKMNKVFNSKPVDTVFSVNSTIDNQSIINAKKYMIEHYHSRYSHIPAHLTYAIVPLLPFNLENAKTAIIDYIKTLKPIKLELSDIRFDPKDNIYSIDVLGNDVKKLHEDLHVILNNYRDNCVRSKDLKRINEGYFGSKELAYLEKYGYSRVMDLYKPHISIGNFTIDNVDNDVLMQVLREMLKDVLNKSIEISNIRCVFYRDAHRQHDIEVVWSDEIVV